MTKKDTLNRLKSKEREDRKNLIIDAAERVFSNKPFDKVSMREIADEAGIATSSIYTYFPNQEALFVEATARDSNQLLDELEKIIVQGRSDKLLIDRVIETFIEYISRHDAYFRMMVVFMTQGGLDPESMEKIYEVVRRGLDMFCEVFESSDLHYSGNLRDLSHHFFAMLNGILVTFRKLPGRSDDVIISHMKRVAKVFSRLLVNGADLK